MKPNQTEHARIQAVLATLAGPERDTLLRHLKECDQCAGAFAGVQDALFAALYLPPPRPMDAERQEEVRARLLASARAAPAPSAPRRRTPPVGAASGWLIAAGLASLLLTHHTFHRPLALGWLVASALGIALFAVTFYVVAERRRSATLRERLTTVETELARVRAHALAGNGAPRMA